MDALLVHDSDQIAEKSPPGDSLIFNTKEFRVAQKRHSSAGGDSEPGMVEKTHQVPHADNPVRLVNFAGPCKEDILPSLHPGP